MAKSQTKTEESGQVIYAQSEPFREIVQALFPNHSWEYFLENLDQVRITAKKTTHSYSKRPLITTQSEPVVLGRPLAHFLA